MIRRARGRWVVVLAVVAAAVTGCTSAGAGGPDSTGQVTAGAASLSSQPGVAGTGLQAPNPSGDASVTSSAPATTAAAVPPVAPTLAWLSGPAGDGVELDTSVGRLWQGPVAGQSALITSDGYDWFGADGALVTCTDRGGCVGVDATGLLAVITAAGGPRWVYRSDGSPVGQFDAAGRQTGSATGAPSLADAIAASGVDLAAAVDAATARAPFAGGITGDPHLVTAGGVRLTSQATGQFIARSGDPDHAIQLQIQPMAHRSDVAIVTGVAIDADGSVVQVGSDGTVIADRASLPAVTQLTSTTLISGAELSRWPATAERPATVAVLWPDGGSVVVDVDAALGLTVVARLPDTGAAAGATGLFGTVATTGRADLLDRSGHATNSPAAWLVSGTQNLFSTPVAPTSGFPTTSAAPGPQAQAVAAAACRAGGLTQSQDLTACELDVAVTGDPGFVAGHVAMTAALENPSLPADFAARWPALRLTAATVAALPDSRQVDTTLPAGTQVGYRLTLAQAGTIAIVNSRGCGVDEQSPGMDASALRLFDAAGRPVSGRLALCGHSSIGPLPAGQYVVAVATGPQDANRHVRFDISTS